MSCHERHLTEPRDFSPDPVSYEVVRDAIAATATAPSGANLQPWRFVVVSDQQVKARLRAGAEQEERAFYLSRVSESGWPSGSPLGTDWRKPFLETAPYVIVVFEVHKGRAHRSRASRRSPWVARAWGSRSRRSFASRSRTSWSCCEDVRQPQG